MKFDTIIIGGGLAGLTAAIRLAEAGAKVGLISAGHSSLHFNSGSLLISDDTEENKTAEVAGLLARAGMSTAGETDRNHTRISPLGVMCPARLSLEGIVTLDTLKSLDRPHVAIADLSGFLDFYPHFIAQGLEKEGVHCDIVGIGCVPLQTLRQSPSEMRATNIARVLRGENLWAFAEAVRESVRQSEAQAIILPAVIDRGKAELNGIVGRKILYAPTMGISVPGACMHRRLMQRLQSLGGSILHGHRVGGGRFNGNSLKEIYTDRLDGEALRADSFIFAAGSFFGRGLTATPDKIIEPILGLDTTHPASPSERFDTVLLAEQPAFKAGLATDGEFRAMRSGKAVANLYAAGACLAGYSGAVDTIASALTVAENIINKA